MSDILKLAMAALPGLLPSRTVRYQRGDNYVDIDVTVGATRVDYSDEHGVRFKSHVRDYLIPVVDLILSGEAIEPLESDTIVDTNDGTTATWKLMDIEGGEAWRYMERYHTMYRVHVRMEDEE